MAKTTTMKTGYENHQHVVPHDGGWAVKTSSASRPYKVFAKKSEAVKEARTLAEKKRTVLVTHAKNGTIQQHQSFVN